MKKKIFYELLTFVFILLVAAATLFYFRGKISQFNIAAIATPKNVAVGLPQVQSIAQQVEKNLTLPEPLRFDKGTPDAVLTVSGVLLWTNQQRRLNGGLDKLASNAQLTAAAQAKLKDMFDHQYFAHVSPAGLSPSHFVEGAGYAYIETGENLALGNFADDQELVQAWMDSPGHRANILTPQFSEIGVAVGKGTFEGKATWLAVQVFGRPISDCPKVDETLKNTIEANQAELEKLKSTIETLVAYLEQNKPNRGASQQEVDAYNKKVEQYNSVAEQYNNLLQQTKETINQYNAQITAFNNCSNS